VKRAKIVISFLITLALIAMFGCSNTTPQNKLTESEKATMVSEAVTDSYSTLSTASKDYTYTITASETGSTTISDGEGGTLTATLGTDTSGLTNSAYYDDVKSATFIYQFSYTNFHLTATDSDGNEIPVVLNGSVTLGMVVDSDTTTGTQTIIIVFYGNIDGTVDTETFSGYSVDIKYTYTVTSTSTSGKIEGTVNGETINQTYTVQVSAPTP